MSARAERGRRASAGGPPVNHGAASPQRAVVRLRGVQEIPPEALLAMAEGMRRALRLVGVIDVRIELEAEDVGVA